MKIFIYNFIFYLLLNIAKYKLLAKLPAKLPAAPYGSNTSNSPEILISSTHQDTETS